MCHNWSFASNLSVISSKKKNAGETEAKLKFFLFSSWIFLTKTSRSDFQNCSLELWLFSVWKLTIAAWKDVFSFFIFRNHTARRMLFFELTRIGLRTNFWGNSCFLTAQRNMLHILALQSVVLLLGGKHFKPFSLRVFTPTVPTEEPGFC